MDAESPAPSPSPTSTIEQKIRNAAPTFKDVADVLGHEHWKKLPDGTNDYAVTREHWAPEVNRARMAVVNEMMAERRALQTERSMNLGESRETVTVRDPSGALREIPATSEAAIAGKPGFHAKMRYRASRRYVNGQWYDRQGNPISG